MRTVIFCLSLCIPLGLFGQTQCEKVLADGRELYKRGRYDEALDQFWAALVSCQSENKTEEVNTWLKKTQDAYIAELDRRIENEKLALGKALTAQKAAEAAKVAEATARQQAETNAALARERGKKAEARRLALIADNVRAKGRYSDALLLAYLGLRFSNEGKPAPEMMRAFGDAVRDSFATTVFEGKKPLDKVEIASDGLMAVLRLNDQSLYLVRVDQKKEYQLSASSKVFLDFCISPKGNYVAAWGSDQYARIWDREGRLMGTLTGHAEALRFVAFSADERCVVSCSRDNSARLWKLNGEPVATCIGHSGNVYAAAFSQDGNFVLTRSSDGTARVWNLKGEQIATVGNQSYYLHDAEIGPENGQFVTAEADGSTRLWNSDGKMIAEISRHTGAAKELMLSPDRSKIISRGNDHVIRIKDLKTNQEYDLKHPSPVLGMSMKDDGSQLLSWSEDMMVRLWSINGQLVQSFKGHKNRILAASFAQNDLIVTSGKDGAAKLWDVQGNILTEWIINPEHPLPALFLPEGNRILVANQSNQTLVLSPLPQEVLRQMEQRLGLNNQLLSDLQKRYNIEFFE